MVTISVCMIVKNEEAVLARCLDSLCNIADEIIIVDTGSTDKTKEIASKYTKNIYDFVWINDFSAARNFAFSKATKDYIYSADADEVLKEIDRKKFLQLKQVLLPEIEIVEMIYVNPDDCNMVYNYKKEPRPKLFKRLREFRWIDPIHETIALDPIVYQSDIEITHLPQSLHSSRDFKALERELQTKGTLSNRLYSMYAKELFISGTKKDFFNAKQWFEARFLDETNQEEVRIEAGCVIAKYYTLMEEFEQFLSFCFQAVTTFSTLSAEICYLLGEYYEKNEQWTNAITWYKKAALETECFVCITYGGEYALHHVIRLLKQQGKEDEAILYQNYLE